METFSAMDKGARFPFRYLHYKSFYGLLFAVIAFYIVEHFNVSIELAQTLLFPFFLFALIGLVRSKEIQLPRSVVWAAATCWILGGLQIRGYLPEGFASEHIVMTGISGDERTGREFFRRYNTIARTYSTPSMELFDRSFANNKEAKKWVGNTSDVAVALQNGLEWLEVVFGTRKFRLVGEVQREGVSEEFANVLRQWDLELKRDHLAVLRIPDVPTPVILATLPDSISIPREPGELALHFLAWLTRSLSSECLYLNSTRTAQHATKTEPSIDEVSCLEDSISQMTQMLGAWRSPAPLSLARLMSGTFALSQALMEVSSSNEGILAGATELNAGQKMLRKETYPELMSLIRNNFGVARVFSAVDEEDLMKARKEFIGTASITAGDHAPTLGSRLAMVNLILLEKAGLL